MKNKLIEKKGKFSIKKFFPQSKFDWKIYIIKTLPIIIGEIIFNLNGLLDNFMVSHIDGGIDALAYANTYTGIIYTIFFSIQAIGAMFVGQYYGRKDFDKVKQIMNLRIWMNLIIALSFAIPAWTLAKQMVHLIGGQGIKPQSELASTYYLMFIAINWVLTSFNFNTNMLLNETGHSKYAFVSACLTMLTNASINSICLYGFHKPAYYAAFGSIIAATVCFTSDSLFTYYKERKIFINVFKMFHITKPIAKQLLKRIPAMLIAIAGMLTLPTRMIIWSHAYPDNLSGGSGIGEKWMGINAVTILGLVESLSSVASAITSVCASNVSFFVATRLGESDFEGADKHAHSLRGFHALAGCCMSVLMIAVVFGIAYSPATTKGVGIGVSQRFYDVQRKDYIIEILNKSDILKNSDLLNSLGNDFTFTKGQNLAYDQWVASAVLATSKEFKETFLLCSATFIFFNPIWCWFYTSAALPAAGGRNIIGSITILATQWASFIWLIIITYGIVIPLHKTYTGYSDLSIPLELAYFMLFAFDFIRWLMFEIVALKTDWKRNITNEIEKQDPNFPSNIAEATATHDIVHKQ